MVNLNLFIVSGGAPLLEVTRVWGQLKNSGQRPRRTMMFASWGAEEFGLIGSTEWVEEHLSELNQRAVSYLNVDTCIRGDFFNPDASPSLAQVVRDVSRIIPDPSRKESSLFMSWQKHQDTKGQPR